MTQVVYASWVEIPTATARSLGVQNGDLLRGVAPRCDRGTRLCVGHPGGGAVAIPTGLGHTAYGRFARGVGQSPYTLLPAEPVATSGRRWLGVRVRLQKTGQREKLASPAGVAEVDHSPEIFETVSLADAVKQERGGKAPEHANLPSMYPTSSIPRIAGG